jgi:hypothetical protein
MALTATKYQALADHLAQKRIDFDSDTLKCALLKATYVPDFAAHAFLADVKADEAAGTGYAAGGATLTGVTWVKDAGGIWRLKATIPAWDATGGALAAAFAVFYDASPASDATRPLIACWNLNGGAAVTATNAPFTLTQHADGIVTIA